MPVTKIRSRWDSGNLIFHESTSLATIADILKLETTMVTVGSATNDIDFKVFLGAADQYALFDCGTATITFAKVDVALSGDLTVTDAKAVVQGMNTFPKLAPTILTSGAGYTMTAAQMLSGLIRDTITAATAATLPTVADVVALIGGYVAGTSFYLDYSNPGNNTVTLTVDTSAQWTLTGTMTIATTTHRRFLCVIDSATTGTVYSIGDAAA